MATATIAAHTQEPQFTKEQVEQALLDKVIERTIEYQPVNSTESVKLNPSIVKKFLTRPTKKGHYPDDQDVMKFMMLCRSRGLDPWIGDAYLVGYDSDRDGPQFSLITSAQALLVRAELHEQYDGFEAGISVTTKDGQLIERPGEIALPGEVVVGAWARAYRKDCSRPFYRQITRNAYDKGYSLWKSNPTGMLVKCAKAAALRDAFPRTLAGMYVREEMDGDERPGSPTEPKREVSQLDDLADALLARLSPPGVQHEPPEETAPQADTAEPQADDSHMDALRVRAAACQTLEALDSLEADACLDATEEEQAAIKRLLGERRGQLARRGGKQKDLV